MPWPRMPILALQFFCHLSVQPHSLLAHRRPQGRGWSLRRDLRSHVSRYRPLSAEWLAEQLLFDVGGRGGVV